MGITMKASWLALLGLFFSTAYLVSPALPSLGAEHSSEAKGSTVIAPDASLKLLSGGFKFTEGPISDAEGNVYFTDQPNDAIHCWTTAGELKTFMKPAGRSNGLYFDLNGDLLACADERNQLWAIDSDGNHRVLVDKFEGKLLNGPNDLWVHSNGSIYFTDPFYKRPYWDRGGSEQPGQSVYRVTPDRKEVQRLTTDLRQPNGIIGNADAAILYVADIGAGKTYRYRIAEDGSLTEKTLFCNSGSDGMTMDQAGNVYLTGRDGVSRYSPQGALQETIVVPKPWTANVTFGGVNRDTLFITAGDSLFSVKTTVQGVLPYRN